jgi:cell division protein ZapA
MKQLEVTILGQSYILGCPDGGEALLNAAVASVDREMSGIRDAGKVRARERIAVLAALNVQASSAADEPPDLDALIQRIDAALGDDGHLL